MDFFFFMSIVHVFNRAGNGRIVFELCGTCGDSDIPPYLPLGMTIDRKGYLWVTLYFGAGILQINPR